jgi:DNA invertase Pin-like site-specific DNA recombinase
MNDKNVFESTTVIGYARVSTLEQNSDLQENELQGAGCAWGRALRPFQAVRRLVGEAVCTNQRRVSRADARTASQANATVMTSTRRGIHA